MRPGILALLVAVVFAGCTSLTDGDDEPDTPDPSDPTPQEPDTVQVMPAPSPTPAPPAVRWVDAEMAIDEQTDLPVQICPGGVLCYSSNDASFPLRFPVGSVVDEIHLRLESRLPLAGPLPARIDVRCLTSTGACEDAPGLSEEGPLTLVLHGTDLDWPAETAFIEVASADPLRSTTTGSGEPVHLTGTVHYRTPA